MCVLSSKFCLFTKNMDISLCKKDATQSPEPIHSAARRAGKRLYQWTAIDERTRHRYVFGYEETHTGELCRLERLQKNFSFLIQTIQTDNGTEFTNFYNYLVNGILIKSLALCIKRYSSFCWIKGWKTAEKPTGHRLSINIENAQFFSCENWAFWLNFCLFVKSEMHL